MSFILDALRKSEHDRQRQTGPGIADLRPASAPPRFPAWAIALGALLLVNIVVVAILVIRSAPATPEAEPVAAVNGSPASAPNAGPSSPVQATSGSTTQAQPGRPAHVSASVFSTEGLNTPAATGAAAGSDAIESQGDDLSGGGRSSSSGEPEILEPLQTIDELTLRGGVALPPLHLDIHVYGARADGRFVFINQRKYKEGARLPEGPIVDRITREGVVLRYGGNRFLMPRP